MINKGEYEIFIHDSEKKDKHFVNKYLSVVHSKKKNVMITCLKHFFAALRYSYHKR